MEWRGIDSAPKDETPILAEVSKGYYVVVSYWDGGWRESANYLRLRNEPLAWTPIVPRESVS